MIHNDCQVSIVIPVYNRMHLLDQSIQSVLSQSYDNWVAYICDDGSTDDVLAMVTSYDDTRLVYRRFPHAGIGATRNRGLQMVETPYVVMLDSDDIWHVDFLRDGVGFLDRNPQVDMVQTAQGVIDDKGVYQGRRNILLEHAKHAEYSSGCRFIVQDALTYFLTEPFGQNNFSSLLIRSALATRITMDEIDFMEDWDYWMKLGEQGASVAYVDAERSYYRTYNRQVDIERQIRTLKQTIAMVQRHSFPEVWQTRIQTRIIGNLNEMIAFDYLTLGKRVVAANLFYQCLRTSMSRRRVYGLAKCIAPSLSQYVKDKLVKSASS
ncbi:glycosyltransferase family 2 protein [Alicyclobacillus curvatus]|nr:glycosyltransferase family 2 protein [Alicyclobacillus curvatus]